MKQPKQIYKNKTKFIETTKLNRNENLFLNFFYLYLNYVNNIL